MTAARNATWRFIADYYGRHGIGPTTHEIAECFNISVTAARKRCVALMKQEYIARDKGRKDRMRVLMVPDDGKTLAEALRESGESNSVQCGSRVVGPFGPFIRADILRLGWEVVPCETPQHIAELAEACGK